MFKDYYLILEINENSSFEETKQAFKNQALKWHPDRNIGKDTTLQMQEINEAYLILKDDEARQRYNIEYKQYQSFIKQREIKTNEIFSDKKRNEYNVNDEILYKWMNNAQKQSVSLAKQIIEELAGMAKAGANAAISKAVIGLKFYLKMIFFVSIFMLFMILLKTCN